jgi:hypothetical protein
MPRYLLEASYTLDGIRGIISGGGTARGDAVAETVESLGGKVAQCRRHGEPPTQRT